MSHPVPATLPARVTVRCPDCGSERTTLALHDEALASAQRCTDCGTPCEVVATRPVSLGCTCC